MPGGPEGAVFAQASTHAAFEASGSIDMVGPEKVVASTFTDSQLDVHAPALHAGVAPEHVAWSTHCPPVHACGRLFMPGLQRVCPAVQT